MPTLNDSNENENTGSDDVATPVGITIARQQKAKIALKKEEIKKAKKSGSKKGNTFRNEFKGEEENAQSEQHHNKSQSIRSTSSSTSSSSRHHKPVSSWSVFWEGSALYIACVIVPTVIAYVLRFHEYQKWQQAVTLNEASISSSTEPPSEEAPLTLLSTTLDLAQSLVEEYIWTEPVSEAAAYYLCPTEKGPLVEYLGEHMPSWSWCPQPPGPGEENNDLLLSPDAAWTDLSVVVVLSFTLALLRIAIVRAVLGSTNFQDSARMQALMKCKSTHLLSSDYQLTPCGTPILTRKVIQPTHGLITNNTNRNSSSLQLPSFSLSGESVKRHGATTTTPTGMVPPFIDNDDGDGQKDDNDDYVNVGLSMDNSEHDLDPSVPTLAPRRAELSHKDQLPSIPFPPPPLSSSSTNAAATIPSPTHAQQVPPHETPDSPLEYLTDSLLRRCNSTGSGTGGLQGILAKSSSSTGQERRMSPPTSSTLLSSPIRVVPRRPERLYAGPRLATAIFRLAYSTVASLLAWHSFRTADFWPWYVGGVSGTGSTANCWDLTGGAVSVGILDSDFDLRNTVLRRYFLLQASYHFHSAAFHVLSMILLFVQNYRSNDKANPQSPATSSSSLFNTSSSSVNGILKVSTTSYLRSLMHHALALLTIATAYIFSSLRRLVAIGMFAFDVSSWFLHLLQICVNAKNDNKDDDEYDNDDINDNGFFLGRLLTAKRIQYFHRFLVLPAFLACRFGVWGALWYSAWTESEAWLQQLEKTLFPNAALVLQSIWNACMVGLFVANLIYLHRLVYHPHLKRIMRKA